MIDFSFNISHPFETEFKNFWSRAWSTPIKNKFIELEFHTTEALIGVNFLWSTRRDHAGIDIQVSLFGFCAHFNFYDNRHWNYAAGRYFMYDEEGRAH
jgi:hypothetical protein